jgi:hypothetical protein
MQPPAPALAITSPAALDDLGEMITDWERSLRSSNRSPRTVEIYVTAGRAFLTFLRSRGMPTPVSAITREHIEMFLVDLAERPHQRKPDQRVSASYVSQHYRALQQLWKYLRAEGEIGTDPFDRMSPPIVPEQPVPLLSTGEIKALLDTAKGTAFTDRRDTAMIRYIVGKDIQPGTYRTAGPVTADELCSATVNYGREVGPSHTVSRQILNNGDPRGTFVVTIDAADQSFETSACAPWIKE